MCFESFCELVDANNNEFHPMQVENYRKAHAKVPKLKQRLGRVVHEEGGKAVYEAVTVINSKQLVTYQHEPHATWRAGRHRMFMQIFASNTV